MRKFFKKYKNYIWVVAYAMLTVLSFVFGFNPGKLIFANFTQSFIEMITFMPFLFIIIGLFDIWVPKEKIQKHISVLIDIGRILEIERKEILGLARYLAGERILVFESEPEVITYTFSMNTSPIAGSHLKKLSYVAFNKDGNISVHISERDYREYKNQLSFDQLCASFSTLFKQFLEYYKEGNEDRIKNELKSV